MSDDSRARLPSDVRSSTYPFSGPSFDEHVPQLLYPNSFMIAPASLPRDDEGWLIFDAPGEKAGDDISAALRQTSVVVQPLPRAHAEPEPAHEEERPRGLSTPTLDTSDVQVMEREWTFNPCGRFDIGQPSLTFQVKTKRETVWGTEFPQRVFWTSHYLVRITMRNDSPGDSSRNLSVRCRLLNAETLRDIPGQALGGMALTCALEPAFNGQSFMGELSLKFLTHSHQQGGAPFRLRLTLQDDGVDVGNAYSPAFRVLARRPAGDNTRRVYNEKRPRSSDHESADVESASKRVRVERFFSDPRNMSAGDRNLVVRDFVSALQSVPTEELTDLVRMLRNDGTC